MNKMKGKSYIRHVPGYANHIGLPIYRLARKIGLNEFISTMAADIPIAMVYGAVVGTTMGFSTFNRLKPTQEHYENLSAEFCEDSLEVARNKGIVIGAGTQGLFLLHPPMIASLRNWQRRFKRKEINDYL